MYTAALCEYRMEEASRERSEKLDSTQKKLDLFYNNMDLVRKQQSLTGVPDAPGRQGQWVELGGRHDRKKKKKAVSEYGSEVHATVDATPILDPDGDMESESDSDGAGLEQDLDQVLSVMDSGPDSIPDDFLSNTSTSEVKRTRSNFRLVLRPLPPDQVKDGGSRDHVTSESGECQIPGPDQCPSLMFRLFRCPGAIRCWGGSGSDCPSCDDGAGGEGEGGADTQTGSDETGSDDLSVSELSMFDQIGHDDSPPSAKKTQKIRYKEYPRDYHTLEFLPYNPLPDQLEAVIFPKDRTPLPPYHDPYWPRKRDCLDLVRELKGNPQLVSYTGTFITPEARGAR